MNEIKRKTFSIICKLNCSTVVRKPKRLTKNELNDFSKFFYDFRKLKNVVKHENTGKRQI